MKTETLAERALRAVLARRQGAGSAAPPAEPARAVKPVAPAALDTSDAPSIFNSSTFDMVPMAAPAEAFVPSRVVHLVRWPEMRRVPVERLGLCARVCALLAHSPSVGFLVHRRLGLPRDEVMPLLYGLHADGYLRMAGTGTAGADASAAATEPEENAAPAAPAAAAAAASGGIFSRWLGRLLG